MGPRLELVNPETKFLHLNIAHSASLKLPFIERNFLAAEKGIVVCGTAPSLVMGDSIREIKKLQRLGYKIMAVKQAIRILPEYEIIPDFSIAMDPTERQIKKTPIDTRVTYFVASSCHPRMFDYLKKGGAKIIVFHSACGAATHEFSELGLYQKYFPNNAEAEDVAMGGFTVVNRGVALCEIMGAKKIYIAGAPFGWREGQDYYAPTVTEPAGNATGPTLNDNGKVDGKVWYTKADLLPSAISIAKKAKREPEKFFFIGDSIAAALATKSLEFMDRIVPNVK